MSTRRARVARGMLSTASMTLVSNVTGFGRQLAFAWVYGAGRDMDAFLVASVLSQMVFVAVDSAISATLIPVYMQLREASEEDAEIFLGALSGLVVAFTAGAGFLFYLIAPVFVHMLAPGFDPSEAHLSVLLLRVMMPSLLFMGLASVLTGVLRTKGIFGQPAGRYIPRNVALVILAAWLGHRYGIAVLAWGSLLGAVLQLYVVWAPLRRFGGALHLAWQPYHHGIRTMLRRLPGVFTNFFMGSAAVLIDRILASGLHGGAISALNYALLLISFPVQLFSSSATALFPTLAELAARDATIEVSHAVYSTLRVLTFAVAPISMYAVFLRVPLITIVYARGAFGPQAVDYTSYAMLFFALGMISMVANGVLSRTVFALGESRILYSSAAWGVGTTIVMDLLLVHPMQQGGLALGTSLGSWAGTIVLLRFLATRLEKFDPRPILEDAVVSSLLAAVAFGAVLALIVPVQGAASPHSVGETALILVGTFLTGVLLYLVLCSVFGRAHLSLRRLVREGIRAIVR